MDKFTSFIHVPKNYNKSKSSAKETEEDVHLNVVKIKYDSLKERTEAFTSPPKLCQSCKSIFNMYSKTHTHKEYLAALEKNPQLKLSDGHKALAKINEDCYSSIKENELVWICEFCYFHNVIDVNCKKVNTDDVYYLLEESAKKPKEISHQENTTSKDESKIIFCIDVSGSMSCTHSVNSGGKQQYITRLQAVKNSILAQINSMKLETPSRRIGIVLFEDEVVLKGDCCSKVINIRGNDLNDFDKMFNTSMEFGSSIMQNNLSQSFDNLKKSVQDLQTGGITALGPGLVCSLGLAAGCPGSKVIICTDGLANKGLGNVEGSMNEGTIKFYDRCCDVAVENGISISVVTIKGNACKVEMLGPLTDRTAGTITRVDPASLNFGDITKEEMIATHVELKMLLHSGLAIRNEDKKNLSNDGSLLMKSIGNVTKRNQTIIEYRLKSGKELQFQRVDLSTLDGIPLQAQVTFKDNQGDKYLRVITHVQMLTQDIKEAERNANVAMIADYVQKKGAETALKGDIGKAKQDNEKWKAFLQNKELGAEKGESNDELLQKFNEANEEFEQAIDQLSKKSNNQALNDDLNTNLWKMKQK